jgi:hypothetical protein
MKKRYLVFLIAVTLALTACGGRLPSPARSQKIIEHFFHRYAKKYPDTVYGQNKVKEIQVEKQTEIRKHFATVESYVILNDGSLRKINATVEKGPLGWKFVSWEDNTGL